MDDIIACMKIIESIIIELGKMAELEEGDDESDENTTENSSSDFELVSKKNTKALVWKYFGFEVDANGQPLSMEAPKCPLCYNNVAVKDSNTTNLHSHLKHKHPEEYSLVQRASEKGRKKEKAPDPNQPSLTATWDKQKLLLTSSREHKELTKSVANCLVKFGGIGKIIPGFDSTNVSRYTGISHKLYNSTHIHDMPVICTPTGLHGITSNTV